MKIFSPPLILFFLFVSHSSLNAQCTAGLLLIDDGKGGYTFQSDSINNDSSFTSYWLVDTVVIDSNTLNTNYKFYTNGNHQVCFQYADTTGCSIDTCITISVQDAEYHPLLDTVNFWSIAFTTCPTVPIPYNSSSRSCYEGYYPNIYANDVQTIGGLNYKKIVVGNDYDSCLLGFIREDTIARKVYFLDAAEITLSVIYDFSMQVNDTIVLTFQNNPNYGYFNSGTYRLDSINMVSIASGERRAFFFHFLNGSSEFPLIWVEGVGCLVFPVYTYSINYNGDCGAGNGCGNPYTGIAPYFSATYVTCFQHTQYAYFDSCSYAHASAIYANFTVRDSCYYISNLSGVIDVSILSSFNLSPNPSTGLVTINMQVAGSSEFEIAVLDMEGRQVSETYPLGKLETGPHSKQIDLSILPSGFYLVECKTNEGSLYRKLVIAK